MSERVTFFIFHSLIRIKKIKNKEQSCRFQAFCYTTMKFCHTILCSKYFLNNLLKVLAEWERYFSKIRTVCVPSCLMRVEVFSFFTNFQRLSFDSA